MIYLTSALTLTTEHYIYHWATSRVNETEYDPTTNKLEVDGEPVGNASTGSTRTSTYASTHRWTTPKQKLNSCCSNGSETLYRCCTLMNNFEYVENIGHGRVWACPVMCHPRVPFHVARSRPRSNTCSLGHHDSTPHLAPWLVQLFLHGPPTNRHAHRQTHTTTVHRWQ